jgi:CrcB protein
MRRRLPVLAAIAAGGVVGAEARYAAALLGDQTAWFPWATLAVNVLGCVLIGMFMAVLLELTAPHRLMRPFLGIGVLGGFTTFSTYAVDVRLLVDTGREAAALGYFAATPVLALTAAWLGTTITDTVLTWRRGAR